MSQQSDFLTKAIRQRIHQAGLHDDVPTINFINDILEIVADETLRNSNYDKDMYGVPHMIYEASMNMKDMINEAEESRNK